MPITSPTIASFFDRATYSYSHVLSDPASGVAAVVDAVRNYDPTTGQLSTDGADELIGYIEANNLTLEWILETHIHADHFSAGPYLQQRLGGKLGISRLVGEVQQQLSAEFAPAKPFPCDGSQFDALLEDGAALALGNLTISVLHTPGHTPACLTYSCGDTAFVGDALFMPDFGTGRTDFPGGNAGALYQSIQRILSLPEQTTLYLCHDYGHESRDGYSCKTSVADERRHNVHLCSHTNEAEFVRFRETRDADLKVPALYHCAVPFNIRGAKAAGE